MMDVRKMKLFLYCMYILSSETKGEDLLLIYNTVKLEYPDYTGRRIDQVCTLPQLFFWFDALPFKEWLIGIG